MDKAVKEIYCMMLIDNVLEPGRWKVESTGYKTDTQYRRFYMRFYDTVWDTRNVVQFDTKLPLPLRHSKEAASIRVKVFKTVASK